MRLFLAGVSILTVLATSPLGISQAVADQCAPGLACNDPASPACLFNPARREWKCTPRGVLSPPNDGTRSGISASCDELAG
jgi:hypothetical protein